MSFTKVICLLAQANAHIFESLTAICTSASPPLADTAKRCLRTSTAFVIPSTDSSHTTPVATETSGKCRE